MTCYQPAVIWLIFTAVVRSRLLFAQSQYLQANHLLSRPTCGSPILSIHFFSPACSQQPYPFAPVARVFPIHPFLLSLWHLLGEHRREGGRRRFLGRAPARTRGGASWGEHRQGMRSVEGGWKTLAESQTLLCCLSTTPPSSSSSPSSSALFPPLLTPISSSHRRVSTVLAPQISGAQLPSLSRLSTLGSNAARILLLSLQADLTSRRLHPRFPRGLLLGFVCLVLFFMNCCSPLNSPPPSMVDEASSLQSESCTKPCLQLYSRVSKLLTSKFRHSQLSVSRNLASLCSFNFYWMIHVEQRFYMLTSILHIRSRSAYFTVY